MKKSFTVIAAVVMLGMVSQVSAFDVVIRGTLMTPAGDYTGAENGDYLGYAISNGGLGFENIYWLGFNGSLPVAPAAVAVDAGANGDPWYNGAAEEEQSIRIKDVPAGTYHCGHILGFEPGFYVTITAEGAITPTSAFLESSNSMKVLVELSVVGAPPPAGPAGPAGPPGANGNDGLPGANGSDGAAGANGNDGAAGENAPCVSCEDVASSAVDLTCLVLGETPPTSIADLRAGVDVIVASLMISANLCEGECDLSSQIDDAITTKLAE